MTGDELTLARRKAAEIVHQVVLSLRARHGDSHPMRRLVNDLDWIDAGLGGRRPQ